MIQGLVISSVTIMGSIGLCGCAAWVDLGNSLDSDSKDQNSLPLIGSKIDIETGSLENPLDHLFENKALPGGDLVKEVEVVSPPEFGNLQINGLNIKYTPDPGFTGVATFTYRAKGVNGAQTVGEIKIVVRKPHSWSGDGSDNLWSNSDNWFKGPPSNHDVAIFDQTCNRCQVELDSSVQLGGIDIAPSFSGSIELKSASSESLIEVTLGEQGLKLSGGQLSLNQHTLIIQGPLVQENSILNLNSGTIRTEADVTLSDDSIINAHTSTWNFGGALNSTVNIQTQQLNNVTFTHTYSAKTIIGTVSVLGDLRLNGAGGSLNTGSIRVQKNLYSDNFSAGTAMIEIAGSQDQHLTGNLSGGLPNFTLNSSGGTVFISGTLSFARSLTYLNGNIDFGASTLRFYGASGGTIQIPESLALNNVIFKFDSSAKTLIGTLSIYGSVSYDILYTGIAGGVVKAYGPIHLERITASGGPHLLQIVGTNDQVISGTNNGVIQNLEIAKTGGTLTLDSAFAVAKNFTYTSGSVNFLNGTVTFTGANTGGVISVPDPAPFAFGHVRFTHNSTGKTISGRMVVQNSIYFNVAHVSLGGGVIELHGDMNLERMHQSGSTVIELKGSQNQLLTGTSNGHIPHLIIEKSGGTATFTGEIGIARNFTYISGLTDFNSILGKSTLTFRGANTGGTITPGNIELGDLNLVYDSTGKSLVGNLTVKGNLYISTPHVWMSGGLIEVHGNLTMNRTGGSPASVTATQIKLTGSNDQSLSHNTSYVFPGKVLTIDKTAGNVTLISNVHLNSNQDLSVSTSQNINLQTFNFNGNGTLTCNSGTILKDGSSFWTNGTINNLGCSL